MKEELANSEVEGVAAKVELELILNKMKFIAIDAILHARAELMEEFKSS